MSLKQLMWYSWGGFFSWCVNVCTINQSKVSIVLIVFKGVGFIASMVYVYRNVSFFHLELRIFPKHYVDAFRTMCYVFLIFAYFIHLALHARISGLNFVAFFHFANGCKYV